ncbi:hypothetical protein EJF18_20353 [Clavispora lusitaniae]|uniref:Uncharacterized protein n=1 Tax=Clavispora lusitaniae TaxID=36911 RepID=A0ACD0WFY4_CLALS|nr:hypothetical protein EJF14_20353 [Clavispora lusitaniae]QFZ32116.1 hypothetical protein EJF16_20353 [Clavispora lusitaniae]QFZ37785.1 hypothetical protein EJF15_20353 [Clavispora lusitaniae]QFZ43469.1 hypothetical protein EJF18_20353 [Clavispora lusitaniae]QFZ49145.1 hypothetical protein EJF17_20353 [Clavispora lusitaniae]
MPFNVTVEHPNTWVVSLESHNNIRLRVDINSVSNHRVFRVWSMVRCVKCYRRLVIRDTFASFNNSESMTMQMERMLTSILVVKTNVNDVILSQHNSMHVTVDVSIGCKFTGRQSSTNNRNFRSSVSDVVEESVVNTIAQVIHDNINSDNMVSFIIKLLLIERSQVEVIKEIKFIDHVLIWFVSLFIIDNVVGRVQNQIFRNHIQHIIIDLVHESIVLVSFILGMNQNTVTSSNSNVNHTGRVFFHINTINFNNLELVIFHVQVLRNKTTNIDDSDKIRLVWFHVPSVVSGIVEQSVLGNWFGTGRIVSVQKFWNQNICSVMIPFTNSQNNLFIELEWVFSILFFNDEDTSQTISVLTGSVRVVPVSSHLIRNSEVVQHGVTRSNRTLSNHFWAIHLRSSVSEQTVEVQRSVSVVKTIIQKQLDSVTLLNSQGGQRPSVVKTHNFTFENAIRVTINPCSSEVPCVSFSRNEAVKQRKDENGKGSHIPSKCIVPQWNVRTG